MVKFISYDGRYPNLCSGTLVVEVDGEVVTIGKYGAISSGGSVWFSKDWDEHVEYGDWLLGYSEEYDRFTDEQKREILQVVNDNIIQGCCGGCI